MMKPTYYRIWCKTCNDFTLHKNAEADANSDNQFNCTHCDTIYTNIKLIDIPEDKIILQRERYIKFNKRKHTSLYDKYLGFNEFSQNSFVDLFKEDWAEPDIVESDAGQKAIDDKRIQKEAELREERRILYKEERELVKKFAKLGRNDKCLCGKVDSAGNIKKYKNCCWNKIQSIK